MCEAVAWAVVFVRDGDDLRNMAIFKERARAEQYAGDPYVTGISSPKRVRPLVFGDEPDSSVDLPDALGAAYDRPNSEE